MRGLGWTGGASPSTAGDPASAPYRMVHHALQLIRVCGDFRTFRRLQAPVLVHSQAKSGTTSLEDALRRGGVGGLKVHYLGPQLDRAIQRSRLARAPMTYHLYVSTRLRAELIRLDGRLRVVTVVRDPISRTVSGMFQVPRFSGITGLEGDALLDRVGQRLVEGAEVGRLDRWFEEETVAMHGVDPRRAGFDIGGGAQSYESSQGRLLILRMDRLGDHAQTLSDFTGVEVALSHNNRRSLGAAAARYAHVVRNLRLPASTLDMYYDTEWMRTFFKETEVADLRRRWGG